MRRLIAGLLLAALAAGTVAPAATAAKRRTAKATKLVARKAGKARSNLPAAVFGGRLPGLLPASGSAGPTGGSGAQDGPEGAPSEPQPLPSPPSQPDPPAAGAALGVQLREFDLTPSRLTLPAGRVTVQAQNVGEDPHDLKVVALDGQGGDSTFPEVAPQTQITRTLQLGAGRYYLFCALVDSVDHEAAGMSATVTVAGG